MASMGRLMRHLTVALWCGVGLLLLDFGPALAQMAPDAPVATGGDALTGVLARIRQTGTVRLGYRAHAPPFSYAAPGKTPYGYSIDLCLAIVEEITGATGGHPLRIEYHPVTPANRIDRVANGEIDLECGATTNTAERGLRVAFSPLTFVTGTRLAVPRASGLRTRRDLEGRKVAVARGTTNESVIRQIIERTGMRTTIVTADDIAQAFGLVAAGQADAVAATTCCCSATWPRPDSAGATTWSASCCRTSNTASCSRATTHRWPQRSPRRSGAWPRAVSCAGSTCAGSSASCRPACASACR